MARTSSSGNPSSMTEMVTAKESTKGGMSMMLERSYLRNRLVIMALFACVPSNLHHEI